IRVLKFGKKFTGLGYFRFISAAPSFLILLFLLGSCHQMESKILVAGCKKTGKTTLLESVDGHLDENTNNYIVDFQTREDGNVRFICTETSNTKITRHWDFNGFVVIFDLTNVPSYKEAKSMCRELRMVIDKPIALVGNKDDLPKAVHDIASHKQFKVQLFSVSAMGKRKQM
ncbi:hypothetical protein MKW98_030819, partial [Papaver atlanticum]